MDLRKLITLQTIYVIAISLFHTPVVVNLIGQGIIILFMYKFLKDQQKQDLKDQESTAKTLESSAKLAALGEIAAGIAHEINNPVAIVHGKAQLIWMQIEEAKEENKPINLEELAEHNQHIIQTVNRIDKIINGLRYFVRDDVRNPLIWAQVDEIVENIQVLSVDRCRKNGVSVKINNSLPAGYEFYCKPTQISQVLINLINNSFDALKNQDKSYVKWIEVNCFERDTSLVFQVMDSGPGLPEEAKDKILKTFYTSKVTTKDSGMGIGLSIAKRIVQQHKGHISLLTDTEHTTFEITLPKEGKND